MKNLAIIPAAGLGKRMGAGQAKQFLSLHGESILSRTLEVFQKAADIDGVYLVVAADQVSAVEQDFTPRFSKIQQVVAGGAERQDSVIAGFKALPTCDIVCVHDGVRPLLSTQDLSAVIHMAQAQGAAILGRPVHETVKRVNDQGLVQKTVDRKQLWSIQTPQCFRYEIFAEAVKKAEADNFQGTDEAMLVEYTGFPVTVIEGDVKNIKITTPHDMALAEHFINGGFSS
jgi:2-C-methyl-D-erythritol 4-phosphate cytidylyltransferase